MPNLSTLNLPSSPLEPSIPVKGVSRTLEPRQKFLSVDPATGRVPIAPQAMERATEQPATDIQKMTVAELGRKLKSDRPDLFGQYDDEEVGRKMLERKPEMSAYIMEPEPEKPQVSWIDQMKTVNPLEIGKGALKGIGNTVLSIGQLGSSALEAAWNATLGRATGIKAFKGAEDAQAMKESELMTRNNLGQKLGFGAEQLAEFFVPSGAVSKGAKAVEGLNAVSKMGKYGQAGTKLLSRAALEGLSAAGVTAAQQGKIDKNVGVNLLLGAGGELAGKAVSTAAKTLSPALKSSALKSYSQALAATTKNNKYLSEKIVPKLIDDGVTAFSREGLMNKFNKELTKAETAMDLALGDIPKDAPVNLANVINDLEEAKKAFMVAGAEGKMVAADPQAIKHIEGFQNIIREIGVESAPYESVRKLRQIWDKGVRDAGGYYGKTLSEGSVIEAQKQAANSLRSELAKEFPDMDKANKNYSFWSNAQKVLGDTIERTQSQRRPLTETIRRTTGAVIGSSVGGGMGAVVGDIAMSGLTKLVDSTAWKTIGAVQKNKIADLLAGGRAGEAIDLIIKIAETTNVSR